MATPASRSAPGTLLSPRQRSTKNVNGSGSFREATADRVFDQVDADLVIARELGSGLTRAETLQHDIGSYRRTYEQRPTETSRGIDLDRTCGRWVLGAGERKESARETVIIEVDSLEP